MSNNNGYHRCQYQDETGRDCDNWFKSDEGLMCILHRESIGPVNALVSDEFKSEYIKLRDAEVALVSQMTLDEIDAHIAGIERVIENERTKLLSSRAVRSGKLQDLSDEERAERKKIKYVGTEGPAKVARVTKVEKLKATIKADPVQYFIDSLGFTRENAEAFARSNGLIK